MQICLPWLLGFTPQSSFAMRDRPAISLGSTYDPVWTEFEGEGADRPYFYNLTIKDPPRNPFAGVMSDCRFPLGGAEKLADGLTLGRIDDRQSLLESFDAACRLTDQSEAVRNSYHHHKMALSMLKSLRTREALDIAREPLRARYKSGMHLFGQATLAGESAD